MSESQPMRVIMLDVNDPEIVQVVDKALDRAVLLPRRKRADAVLTDLRRYAEGESG